MMAGERGCLDANALFQPLGPEISAPWPRGNGDVNRECSSRNAHGLRPVKDNRPDIAGLEIIEPDHVTLRLHQRALVKRHPHHEYVSGIEQSVSMLLQSGN